MDGVSLLLEVLRAVQLSQNTITGSSTLNSQTMELRNNQSYQRRAQLDELACLQCLSICCSRSHDAAARLGTTPVGLLPLACSATGTGIRARIFSLQLLTVACDKNSLGDHAPKAAYNGHQAVSESLSTLRLRCAEPVRFRLLIGILNSGGGSGELQFAGMRFLNTLMESSENLQIRLYLQAELFQAGLEPHQMSKLISSTSPWMQKLLDELKRWDAIKIDIERLQKDVRSAEQCRSKMVILERKVEMLQEERNVFTSIERRLQEKCAELQRELMQLKKSNSTASTLEKRPVALPRQTITAGNVLKKNSSENEDEGISSSETGQSSSPIPPIDYHGNHKNDATNKSTYDDDLTTTIDDVIEELTNIVNDAEREITEKQNNNKNIIKPLAKSKSDDVLTSGVESEIVVNLLPQPPRKSNKSLVHILGAQNDADGSDYDLYYADVDENNQQQLPQESPYENDYELARDEMEQKLKQQNQNHPDIINTTQQFTCKNNRARDDNRQLLNVIMDAREKEQQKAFMSRAHSLERDGFPSQQFSGGVFFMSDMMNRTSKFSKPDIMAAIEAKRVSKNVSVDSMIDVVMSTEQKPFHHQKPRQIFLPTAEKFSPPQNVAFNNFKFKNINVNPTLFDQQPQPRTQSNNGSKVTDLISGLY
ncbi:CLUMA_CG014239, isoform A [Clunio marinus]|uniref:CLUMA_CG014239, isoform A n=1 Tax=Clunio marinus TaxID=568069 RepID=A0A1J1ILN3_9DIPT|nr:CLUMA_CG014239, isoform A [Clunio marinus]